MEKRIGFGRRLGAYALDALFVIGIAYIIANLAGDSLEAFVDWSKMDEEQLSVLESKPFLWMLSIMLPVASIFASFIYGLLEAFTGYTVGKLMLGIQVGNQDGTPANINKYMLRYALKNISTLIGLIGLVTLISAISTTGSILGFVVIIGCFFVLGENKLAFHDMLAKTAIYRKNELADGTAAKSDFMD